MSDAPTRKRALAALLVSTAVVLLVVLMPNCGRERAPASETSTSESEPESESESEPDPDSSRRPSSGAANDRTILPITPPPRPTYTALDVRGIPTPKRFEVTAPAGAPNVLVILLDDFGFGVSSTFGGPVVTPTMDQLAAQGLRYNNFHTTALCSPTRVALKTGRNHHMANAGSITESATGFPGNTGEIPKRIASLPEILRFNGYSTAAVGKWHETPVWETSAVGPFDEWPLARGFEYFYGFLGGETNQWSPALFDGQTRVEPPQTPDYHFLVDMTDRAIQWVQAQHSLAPDKPFFMYYAPGATHAPHHVPKAWIAQYEGRFDAGWDALRAETFARQKQLGVIPPDTKLPDKPSAIQDWEQLSALEQRVFARQAEVFAGYAAMADHEAGRLIQAIEELGEADNTLIMFIAGDNGTSAEGTMVGLYNEMTYFNEVTERIEDLAGRLDEWGSPSTYPHMAAGWAIAFDSPFAWAKQVASDFGGTRNGMIVRWPKHIRAAGQLRSQFHHVIDVAPTVLAAAKLPEPKLVDGIEQIPMQGVSMMYSFDDAAAADRHLTQYFEIFGNRAIYHDGWFARTVHKAPWEMEVRRPLSADVWELYHVDEDFSLATDLAEQQPDKLAELQALFMREAEANHVLPLDDRFLERMDPRLAGRPDLLAGRTQLTLYPGMVGMLENTFINIKNASFTISAVLDVVDDDAAQGTVLAQGGRFGGWSLYAEQGKPKFTYNFLGLEVFTVASEQPMAPGRRTVRFEFVYDGGGRGAGGVGTLRIDDVEVGQGRIAKTQPTGFSADETADVGIDLATGVVESIGGGPRSGLTGAEIEQIVVEVERGATATP